MLAAHQAEGLPGQRLIRRRAGAAATQCRPTARGPAEPVAAAPPPEVPDDDMLRRVSDIARALVIGAVVVPLLWGLI